MSYLSVSIIWLIKPNYYWLSLRHPYITKEERDLIEISLGNASPLPVITESTSVSSSIVSELDGSRIDQDDQVALIEVKRIPEQPPIPFKAIFTSVPFWAIMITHSCQNWGFYTLLSELPTYMNKILHFDIKEVRNLWDKWFFLNLVLMGYSWSFSECSDFSFAIPMYVDFSCFGWICCWFYKNQRISIYYVDS